MYKLKEKPEDFIVIEKSNVEMKDSGRYTYFLLKKTNYNTTRALSQIAKALHVQLKDFSFAGNKDKIAVTEQVCSVKDVSPEKIDKIVLTDIEIKSLGKGDEPISLGDLEGNNFELVVYSDKEPVELSRFVNFFGKQRFGINNVEIGRCVIKKDFKKLNELLDCESGIDFLGSENRKVSRIYIHAYQSYIWNESVKKLIGKDVEKVPIVGFGTEFENDEVKEVVKGIMKEEGISKRDFIIRQIPQLSAEGDMRPVYCDVKELKIEKSEENKYSIKFFLPKGCYATVFMDQLFG